MNEKNSLKYKGLNSMLSQSSSAQMYFMSLPEHVQGAIQQHEDNFTTEQQLHSYAENMLRGGNVYE